MTDFPLCKQLGLEVHDFTGWNMGCIVRASDLEALLAKGVRVTGSKVPLNGWRFEEHYGEETHTALLIDIQPIRKESAEDVLREVLAMWKDGNVIAIADLHKLMERARRVLDAKPPR